MSKFKTKSKKFALLTVAVIALAACGGSSENSSSESTAAGRVKNAALLTVPGAPTALTGTPGVGEVALSWTAPTNTVGSEILSYYIEKSTDGAKTWSKAASTTSATSATASGLTAGEFHYFRVIAANSVGRGGEATIKGINPLASTTTTAPAASIVTAVPVLKLTVPGAPTALTGTPGVGEVALSWTAPTNTVGSEILSYYIEKSTDGAKTWSKAASTTSATSATASGLTAGAFHYFRVIAANSVGRGGEAMIKGVNPLAIAPLTCATGGTCVIGDTGPGGGKVFYVASTNFTSGAPCGSKCRYLEAAPAGWIVSSTPTGQTNCAIAGTSAADPRCEWSAFTSNAIGTTAQGTAIGAGYANTSAMVAQGRSAGKAGSVARLFQGGGKADWSLPSREELTQLYRAKTIIGGISSAWYSSSSEIAAGTVWMLDTRSGSQASKTKLDTPYVRPVRAF